VSLYINRFKRVRHADPDCYAIRASKVGLEDYRETRGGVPPARFVEIPDPTDPAELQAIRDFTSPCFYCVPGARESWESLPLIFEQPIEREPDDEWNHMAVIVRKEPSPSNLDWVVVVGASRDGAEVVVDHGPDGYTIGEIVDLANGDDEVE
jgi:hypothetical protein